jgi:dephospho-CoA kinase
MKKSKDKILVGITGGIGSGKTTFCRMLAEKGFKVFYADLIARELYLKDKKLLKQLVKVCSKNILNFKGIIILPKLKEFIFSNKKNYEQINSIVHPVVINYLKKEIQEAKEKVIIIEAALIFESKFNQEMDYVITVYSNKKTRLERMKKRDAIRKSDVEKIMKFQMDEKKKISKSDFVIVNNKSEEDLVKQAELISNVLKAIK